MAGPLSFNGNLIKDVLLILQLFKWLVDLVDSSSAGTVASPNLSKLLCRVANRASRCPTFKARLPKSGSILARCAIRLSYYLDGFRMSNAFARFLEKVTPTPRVPNYWAREIRIRQKTRRFFRHKALWREILRCPVVQGDETARQIAAVFADFRDGASRSHPSPPEIAQRTPTRFQSIEKVIGPVAFLGRRMASMTTANVQPAASR